MTYDEKIDILFEASRQKIHAAIDAATEETRQKINAAIDAEIDEFATQPISSSEIDQLSKRPSFITSDFIWKYYPLVLSGAVGAALAVAAAIIWFNK